MIVIKHFLINRISRFEKKAEYYSGIAYIDKLLLLINKFISREPLNEKN